MKYITFKDAHVYTCLAILLEDFNINKTDEDIIKDMRMPYLFASQQRSKTKMVFTAGTRLQGKPWFDLFLNQHKLEFIEEHLTRHQVFTMLENLNKFKRKALLSMHINHGEYAVVFSHHNLLSDKFVFILPEEVVATSYHFLELTRHDLETYLGHHVTVGFINPTTDLPLSIVAAIKKSLETLSFYQTYINEWCQKQHTKHRQREAFELVFHPLLVDLRVMMKLKGETDIYEAIKSLSHQYVRYLKTDQERFDIPLADEFSHVISIYIAYVKTYLKRVEHVLH